MSNFISVTPILATGLLIAHPHIELKAPISLTALEIKTTQTKGAPPIPWLPWLPQLPPSPTQGETKPDQACRPVRCIQTNRITLDKDFAPIPFPILKVGIGTNL